MAKKPKVELTLEELQAKKSKNQRGWVRFCAILLAVVLTAGIFGLASSGDPKVVSVYPNVVRAQTQTVVQKQDPTTTEPDNTDDEDTPSTPGNTEESGGILDTLLGLLGSIDLSSLAGKLNFEGLGVTIASGIQTAKDSLLGIIDQIEASLTGKPSISHDPVEYDFAADMDRGDEIARTLLVEAINNATARKFGYTVNHMVEYTDNGHVSIGEQTETVNQILGAAGFSLDDIIGEFVGRLAGGGELIYIVDKDQTAEDAVAALEGVHASAANYGLMPTQLTADDIAIVEGTNPLTGTYVFRVKNVDNPNRRADCGLTRLTNDYLVQPEVAERIKNLGGLTEVSVTPLKLTDLITSYSDIEVTAQLDALGNLQSMKVSYTVFSKFNVRTNTVQVIGASTMEISDTYSGFVY